MNDELYQQAIDLLNAGDYNSAIPVLEQITRSDNNHWRAFNRLGFALAQVGHLETAIGAFRRAVEISPSSPKLHYNLAQAYEQAGVPSEALHEYSAALDLDSSYQLAQEGYTRSGARLKEMEDAAGQ